MPTDISLMGVQIRPWLETVTIYSAHDQSRKIALLLLKTGKNQVCVWVMWRETSESVALGLGLGLGLGDLGERGFSAHGSFVSLPVQVVYIAPGNDHARL